MRNYNSEGFVIGRKKFGEADRIITLFTKDHGKISVLAKGVRKLTSRKRGGVENFSQIKFSASKSHTLDILSEVEVINNFSEIRSDLKKTTIAYYLCEVINKVTRDEEDHGELYKIFEEYFNKIESSKNLKQLRLKFVKEVLVNLGFWPHEKPMDNPDAVLEGVTERQMNSFKIGRKMLQQN